MFERASREDLFQRLFTGADNVRETGERRESSLLDGPGCYSRAPIRRLGLREMPRAIRASDVCDSRFIIVRKDQDAIHPGDAEHLPNAAVRARDYELAVLAGGAAE